MNPVTGKVLYKGQPIKGATVFFHPVPDDIKAQKPTGTTDEDGNFSLITGVDKGAPAGKYVVTIVWYKEAQTKKKFSTEGAPDPVDQLQGRYALRERSKIEVNVKPGPQQLEAFKLD